MAALTAVLSTAILNSLERIAAFLLSWAMVGFFGKMPPSRQYILAGHQPDVDFVDRFRAQHFRA